MNSGGFLRSVWRHHTFRLGVAGLAGALVAGLVLPGSPLRVGAQHGAGPEVAPAGVLAGAPAEGLLAAQSSGGQGGQVEGIQVHGEWLIEVRNPDGTLAAQHAFRNALEKTGGWTLVDLIGHRTSASYWVVSLGAATVTSSPCDRLFDPPGQAPPAIVAGPCDIVETGAQYTTADPPEATTLSVTIPNDDPGKLVLQGSVVALRNGSIQNVSTRLATCGGVAPSITCNPTLGLPANTFTSKQLPSSVSVVKGQQIMVTVTISFS